MGHNTTCHNIIIFVTCIPKHLVIMVPDTSLTDRAQRAHNCWRKIFQCCENYLPGRCVIKYMHKRLDMIFVVKNFIWGHPLAIATNWWIVSSTNCFLARSCLVWSMFCYITLHIVTQWHKLDLKLAYLESTHQELSNAFKWGITCPYWTARTTKP